MLTFTCTIHFAWGTKFCVRTVVNIYYNNIQRIMCDLLSQYTKDKDYNNIQRIRCDLL